MLSVFEPTIASIRRELLNCFNANRSDVDVAIQTKFIPQALEHLNTNTALYDQIIADAALQLYNQHQNIEVILLAMFSMARAQPVVTEALPKHLSKHTTMQLNNLFLFLLHRNTEFTFVCCTGTERFN